MMEMVIDSIRVSVTTYQRVVILKGKDSDRYLPIWIGPAEADAIALKLQDVSVARPLTHDLIGSVVASLGASVSRIVVSELTDDTYYAKVVLQVNGSTTEVDSRPSDAIALAVRQGYFLINPKGEKQFFGSPSEAEAFVTAQRKYYDDYSPEISMVCPIFANDEVLEKAGVQMDRETGNPLAAGDRDAKQRPLGDEELKSLSAFSDFFKTLDLEGIGREEQPPAAESNP